MNSECNQAAQNGPDDDQKVGLFKRMFQKLDAKMKEKSAESAPCCCSEEGDKKGESERPEKCC